MIFKGLQLDKFQEDAIAAIDSNHSVIVSAPTGSGKTLIADYIVSRDIQKGIKVIYTAPIKALSNQKYKDFCRDYGEENVGLMTGDIVKNPGAGVLIMTTEIYRNMLMTDDEIIQQLSYVIFDEIHFISDAERGYVWEESIIFSKPQTRFLCLSATIPNAAEFAGWISAIQQHKVEVIIHEKRQVPLETSFFDADLGIATLEQIREIANMPDYDRAMGMKNRHLHDPRHWHELRQMHGQAHGHAGQAHDSRHGHYSMQRQKAKQPSHIELVEEIKDKVPCLFFCFSRSKCEKMADELYSRNLFQPSQEVLHIIHQKLGEAPPEIATLPSTRLLRKTLQKGIAFHHAGLIPVLKDLVEELFCQGLIKVLYTTETFAVGINMPAKTVCFESMRKFDGIGFRYLTSKEFFQIAGRAGRRGIDPKGYVVPMINRRDFDYGRIRKIISKDTVPILSQFRMSPNTVLNMIQRHSEKEIDEILCKSFDSYQKYGRNYDKRTNLKSHNAFANIRRKLLKLGYLTPDGKQLTEKGIFASKIYADEFLIGEIFYGTFTETLSEYHLLLLLACICFEGRDEEAFGKVYRDKPLDNLIARQRSHPYLKAEKRFQNMQKMTALVYPCFHGEDIFKVIENTKMPEGDLLRFYRTLLDRAMQVKKATVDSDIAAKMANCINAIRDCIKLVDVL
jgi:superfamily II RNA helicase